MKHVLTVLVVLAVLVPSGASATTRADQLLWECEGRSKAPDLSIVGCAKRIKGVARGLIDSKKRVAFEADLVEKGTTKEEAGQAWLREYTGQGEATIGDKNQKGAE